MSNSIAWIVSPTQGWVAGYTSWAESIPTTVASILNARKDEILAWMKQNHPWRNRTYLAESTLDTFLVFDALSVTLTLAHGPDVYYSFYLEVLMQNGRFGILFRALDYWTPILLDDLRKAVR